MIVQVPSLVQITYVVGHFVSFAIFLSLSQVIAIGLDKAGLLQCLWSLVQHCMKRLQGGKHPSYILLTKEEPACLFKSLMPLLMPKDCNPVGIITIEETKT